jgi:hypothetical protein
MDDNVNLQNASLYNRHANKFTTQEEVRAPDNHDLTTLPLRVLKSMPWQHRQSPGDCLQRLYRHSLSASWAWQPPSSASTTRSSAC